MYKVFDVSLLPLKDIFDFSVKGLSGVVQTCAAVTEERFDIPANQLVEILGKSWRRLCIALAAKARSLGVFTFGQQLLNCHLFAVVPISEGKTAVF